MAALLLGASGLYAVETTAYTKPSGFVTHTLKAGQFNLIGLTLHDSISVAGKFTTVAGTILTDSNVDFDSGALEQNLNSLIVALVKLKPSSAKGIYVKKVSVSSTMGPGLAVDTSTLDY